MSTRTRNPRPEEIRSVALMLVVTCNATVIPVRPDKTPGIRAWQRMTQEACQRDDVLNRFGDSCPSIAIVAGAASHGLCSLDFDSDEALEEFLKKHLRLRATMTTRGARGANLWIRFVGPCPSLSRITWRGAPAGEVRGNGAYTVVWGLHPSGKRYSMNAHPPLEMRFEDLVWPEGFRAGSPSKSARRARECPPTTPPQPSSESSASLGFCTSAPLHDSPSMHSLEPSPDPANAAPCQSPHAVTPEQILAHARCLRVAAAQLEAERPGLAILYDRYIKRHHDVQPHNRNAVIVQAVPFLYRAVAEVVLIALMRHFWQRHHPMFRATEAEHLQEAEAMLAGVRTTFLSELPEAERALYLEMNPRTQASYRICRDLAAQASFKPGEFFMSAGDLAHRLGVNPRQAHRVLMELCELGVLRIETLGTRRAKGIPGRATIYAWTLPLPPPTDSGSP